MIELVPRQIHLEPRYLEQIKILKSEIPNREVWMHGSRVNGTNYDAGDVDLVFHPDPNAKNRHTEPRHTDLNIQIQLKPRSSVLFYHIRTLWPHRSPQEPAAENPVSI